jgi:AcrR family transcriptional regulator
MEKKEEKEQKLLDSAFLLFTEKGFKDTSIQEIVDHAGVAKGTFYLYFKDKYDIQDYLITYKSNELFLKAIKHVNKLKIETFEDRFIAIIDYLIDEFIKHEELLVFISKNLSLGVFGDSLTNLLHRDSLGILEILKKEIEEDNINIKNPELTIFMIIELTSSVVFSSITTGKPIPIDELKPILYDKIKKMLYE